MVGRVDPWYRRSSNIFVVVGALSSVWIVPCLFFFYTNGSFIGLTEWEGVLLATRLKPILDGKGEANINRQKQDQNPVAEPAPNRNSVQRPSIPTWSENPVPSIGSEGTNDQCCNRLDTTEQQEYKIFTEKQHAAFARDGFLVVSDLLPLDVLNDIVGASHAFVDRTRKQDSYFSSLEMGMIFQAGSWSNETESGAKTSQENVTKAFRNVALRSILPQAAAELMRLSTNEQVRVIRDVFMSKAVKNDEVCDWHVDDIGFWPEAFGTGDKEGVNVWISLEDMPSEYQGSMALSPGSHNADWRHDAYDAIGLNLTLQGGFTKEQMTEMASSGAKLLTTCEMKTQGPTVRKKVERTKWIPDIKKGDVIFATRSLFHRTLPVTPEGKKFYAKRGIEYLNRYSVRYVPGSARLPHGWTFEWSIKSNDENKGSTLYTAMEEKENLLWYPRVWPAGDRDMDSRLDYVAQTELDEMKTRTKNDLYELFALFFPESKSYP